MFARAAGSSVARVAGAASVAVGATYAGVEWQRRQEAQPLAARRAVAADAIRALANPVVRPRVAFASGAVVEPGKLDWSHTGWLKGYDHAALRRGWLVYKNVCAACHGLQQLHWRELVGVVMTEDEAKELAAENDYQGEPDDNGDVNDRPGKLSDPLPRPYPNEKAARAGNGGALPPDLSLIVKARVHDVNYIYALMTGYRDPPAGVSLREGLYYNIYFPGGAIAMAQPLYPNMVEYEDGTEASISQMAKDVAVFLNWASEPEMDQRKKAGFKAIMILLSLSVATLFWRRQKWSTLKSRAIGFTQVKPPRSTHYRQ